MAFDLANVKSAQLSFGTAGTANSVTVATSTSNPFPLPRGNYSLTVQAVATTTATGTSSSTQVANCIATLHASNDGSNWFAISSATVAVTAVTSATNTGVVTASASVSSAVPITTSNNAYAYGRAVVASTGTSGYGYVFFGQ